MPLTSGHFITIQEEFSDIKGGKWGAINLKGEVIVPLEYDSYEEVDKIIEECNSKK
ncbi:MAG: WG repeat-containing protein [Alphaproteobacteria bacterium]|nr:WG repeat-containing protein [Alphaproteobacteria bacterium]